MPGTPTASADQDFLSVAGVQLSRAAGAVSSPRGPIARFPIQSNGAFAEAVASHPETSPLPAPETPDEIECAEVSRSSDTAGRPLERPAAPLETSDGSLPITYYWIWMCMHMHAGIYSIRADMYACVYVLCISLHALVSACGVRVGSLLTLHDQSLSCTEHEMEQGKRRRV